MKTEVSIPDDLFAQAEQETESLGLTRDAFFALALARYFQSSQQVYKGMDPHAVTAAIDKFHAEHPGENRVDPAYEHVVAEGLARSEW